MLSCYHSNETSLTELLHRTIYFVGFYETKFGLFGEFFALATLGVKGLNHPNPDIISAFIGQPITVTVILQANSVLVLRPAIMDSSPLLTHICY